MRAFPKYQLATVLPRAVWKHAQVLRHFGPAWYAFRIKYAWQLRRGHLRRRLPASPWAELPLSLWFRSEPLADPVEYADYRRAAAPRFFFGTDDRDQIGCWLKDLDKEVPFPFQAADGLAEGRVNYFEHLPMQTGVPPNWHRHPITGVTFDHARHWSQIGDFSADDIKFVWEPSRFAFAFLLVRAFWRTGDNAYAELFWQWVQHWRAANGPQSGVNWKCGQEISLRIMAWSFALYGFADAPATTPERISQLAQMIAVSADRIEANINYALSQNNNHGIVEAVGLWTVGVLFPEFRHGDRWEFLGRRLLEQQVRDLVYDDGGFSQHSTNYQRVMMHGVLWSCRLAELQQRPFSSHVYDKLAVATSLIHQLTDMESGKVPCYGQNDSALVLPLSNSAPSDFRPVVQACRFLTEKKRTFEPGVWDEDLAWIFGAAARSSEIDPVKQVDLAATASGYYTLRSPQGFVFTRACQFRHRPSQADLLHADVWWKGINIAADPGTFSYHAEHPWDNPLAHTCYHNTVTVDGRDQMERVGKFMWLPWLRAGCTARSTSSQGFAYWEGEHNGYRHWPAPVRYRRGILRLPNDYWLIVDLLESNLPRNYRLHWLLCDADYQWTRADRTLCLSTAQGDYCIDISTCDSAPETEIVRACPHSPRGWRSPHYGAREPALSLSCTLRDANAQFCTLLGPAAANVRHERNGQLVVQTANDTWTVSLGEKATLISKVYNNQSRHEPWETTACTLC